MGDEYCFDTNIIVLLNRYMPRDVFSGPWDEVEELISNGRAFMPKDAFLELFRVDDVCGPWARNSPGFVVEATLAEVLIVDSITSNHPDWVSASTNAADPYIVAHAEVHQRVIVTDEKRKGRGFADRNIKIPNVADEYGIDCLNFNELARREGWHFGR